MLARSWSLSEWAPPSAQRWAIGASESMLARAAGEKGKLDIIEAAWTTALGSNGLMSHGTALGSQKGSVVVLASAIELGLHGRRAPPAVPTRRLPRNLRRGIPSRRASRASIVPCSSRVVLWPGFSCSLMFLLTWLAHLIDWRYSEGNPQELVLATGANHGAHLANGGLAVDVIAVAERLPDLGHRGFAVRRREDGCGRLVQHVIGSRRSAVEDDLRAAAEDEDVFGEQRAVAQADVIGTLALGSGDRESGAAWRLCAGSDGHSHLLGGPQPPILQTHANFRPISSGPQRWRHSLEGEGLKAWSHGLENGSEVRGNPRPARFDLRNVLRAGRRSS